MARKKKSFYNAFEVQNAAKTFFANIGFMSPDYPLRSIVITSSVPNEGKSITSIELGKAIATSGKRTLLVEADMRRRSLANYLGVSSHAGVYSVLTEAVSLEQAIVPTKENNLFLLDSEPNIPNPADIFSSKSYEHLVSDLGEAFDYVIFDTPPVGTFIDAAILSTLTDGTVLVVKPTMTKRDELLEAYEQLKKADAHVIGTCATFCEDMSGDYYYAYYTNEARHARVQDNEKEAQIPTANTFRAPGGQGAANSGAVKQGAGKSGAVIPSAGMKGGR